MKKMSKMAKMMKMMAGKKKMKMKKGGMKGAQALANKLKAMGIEAKKDGGMTNKPVSKPLVEMMKGGMSPDMSMPLETRMNMMAYGGPMKEMKKGGMMKGKMPKRGMRAAGAMKRKKAKKK